LPYPKPKKDRRKEIQKKFTEYMQSAVTRDPKKARYSLGEIYCDPFFHTVENYVGNRQWKPCVLHYVITDVTLNFYETTILSGFR